MSTLTHPSPPRRTNPIAFGIVAAASLLTLYLTVQFPAAGAPALIGAWALAILSLALTLLPAIIAYQRRAPARHWLLVANVLLAWTLLGWAACLLAAIVMGGEDD